MRITRWDQELTTAQTNEVVSSLALKFLERSLDGTDYVEELVSTLVPSILCEEWGPVVTTELDYSRLSLKAALGIRQALAFFQKRSDLVIPGIDPSAAALQSFMSAERLCSETNDIFRKRAAGGFSFPPVVERVMSTASRKIARVLGDVPSFSDLQIRFGPGATTDTIRRDASPRAKLSAPFACSGEFFGVAAEALAEMPGWLSTLEAPIRVETHLSRVSLVPKSAKTHRTIAVEPGLNTMFQLGIGDYIASRLASAGLSIRDQTPNQRLAKEGSLSGSLATVDLSSASDTISIKLVEDLLPLDWFCLLSRLRTGSCVLPSGEQLRLSKFSAMGNGFTFPLETLIFWALAEGCCEAALGRYPSLSECRAYGDDIIVPVEAYPLLCEVFTCLGFVLNRSKSFASGPFRESCGADYLGGFDIRPCYLKGPLTGQDIFRLHNFFWRLHDEETCQTLVELIDPSIRIYGPDGFGDGHLVSDRNSLLPYGRARGWAGYIFDTFTWVPRRDYRVLPGDRVLPCYTIYSSSPKEGLPGIARSPEFLEIPGKLGHYVSSGPSISYGRGALSFGVTTPGRRAECRRISIYTLVG